MLTQDKLRLIFGLKIAYLRQQRGYSYQQLADLTDLSMSYVHDIEKGKKYPKADKILALAKALDTTYDDLVSVHTSKRLQPIVELFESAFFQVFPMDMFGISPEKLVELFVNAPDKLNAFISTIIKIARNYQMQTENFYTAALRSYQDMHDNYFADLESAVADFKAAHGLEAHPRFSTALLSDLLRKIYGIKVDHKKLPKEKSLKRIRSYYSDSDKVLYINKNLSAAQEHFLLARELGFQCLGLKERPFETVIIKSESFEKLLNNFKASYFASALLMDERAMVADVQRWADTTQWDEGVFMALLDKYQVTSEMFLQRLTNILPKHFNINNLFFIRLQADESLKSYKMTKELHLSRLHSPYANELNEHYCRRWVSINAIKALRTRQQLHTEVDFVCSAQTSHYWESDLSYFCLTVAKPNTHSPKDSISVTLGIQIDAQARQLFRFLNDKNIPERVVNTTCERCSMPDCSERGVAPFFIEKMNQMREIEHRLNALKSLKSGDTEGGA